MNGLTKEMSESLYIDDSGTIKLDDSELIMKWGFDALFSNLGYRLIEVDTQNTMLMSVPHGKEGSIFNGISLSIPMYFSRVEGSNTSIYRVKVELADKSYYFDAVRSDLLIELANEAVEPTIVDVATTVILMTFIIFLSVSVIAIKLIVKPSSHLTKQIQHIKPEDLHKRIDVENVPNELLPIANAMNDALSRVEESFEQQKRFIADAAHELRTPLTILLNRLELKIPPSPTKSELFDDAHFISRIVEQLLDLSRAQNTSSQHHISIKLSDVVKNVCSHIAPMVIDKNQALELIGENDLSRVNVDEGELTVIVKNLLENAIKHIPEGGRIKTTVSNNSIIVEDSGYGIPKEFHRQIFERFWRENQSNRNGSGLGLAITKELISHYNATITVNNNSSLGGAKFTVEFYK
ncbi:sensor histidine kinase [Agaribacter marinus]|nr:HAMP domain-containing sensor histidine kinase [Agaribacter marinus]